MASFVVPTAMLSFANNLEETMINMFPVEMILPTLNLNLSTKYQEMHTFVQDYLCQLFHVYVKAYRGPYRKKSQCFE